MSPESKVKDIFLNPGEFAFGDRKTRIWTLLGSCVAVTFWHPTRHCGAMCHYLLPQAPSPGPPDGRYAHDVIHLILSHFRRQQLEPRDFVVKMFGGSSMFPDSALGENLAIGARNIHLGHAFLREAGFRLACSDLAGTQQRMVIFELWTGDVWVRQGPPRSAENPGSERRNSR
nr:chemotaxis protein CheD [uncultured Holophaga sp.]